jgi:hypothetical protein
MPDVNSKYLRPDSQITNIKILSDAAWLFLKQSMPEVEPGVVKLDEEYNARNWMAFRLLPLLQDLFATKHHLYSVGKASNGQDRIVVHQLGRRFINCIKSNIQASFEMFPNAQFNPYFEMFYKNVLKHNLLSLNTFLLKFKCEDVRDVVHRLNACISEIRSEVSTNEFRTRLKVYRRPIKRQYDTLMTYTSELFARHSRMLILRVDLSYLHQYRTAQHITGTDACKHRDTLLADLHSGAFGLMLGYACKLELGRYKGYHIHGLFFFDSSKLRRDVILGKRIGQHWDKVITGGMGSHYNCNARKERYGKCFLGVVHYTDQVAREGFELYAAYATKPDELLRLALPGIEAFIRGGLAPRKEGPRRGRPRSAGKGRDQWPESLR